MAALLPAPKWRLTKNDGTPAAGWIVNTYTPGGAVTGKATYTTAAATTSNGNSFTLDARGEADVWWNGLYYIAVYKSAAEGGGLVFNIDNYGEQTDSSANIGNLIENGSFENGTDGTGAPNNWALTTYSGSTFSVDTTSVAHGGYAAKGTSTGNGGAILVTGAYAPCSELASVTWSFVTKASNAAVRNVVELLWYDAATLPVVTSTLYDSTSNPTAFQLYSGIATPPATARFVKVRLTACHPSNSQAGSTWFDDIVIGSDTVYSTLSEVFTAALNDLDAESSGSDLYIYSNFT